VGDVVELAPRIRPKTAETMAKHRLPVDFGQNRRPNLRAPRECVIASQHAGNSATIGPDPASYMVARNKFDALAVAESIGLARPATQLLKRVVRPVVSCAVLYDEWQRFTVRKVDTIENLDAKLRDDLPRVDVMLQVRFRVRVSA
jgi:hypothetical protein